MADSKPGVHVLQLKHVSVSKPLLIGEKFLRWDEVETVNIIYILCCLLKCIIQILYIIIIQDSSSITPVTLKVDSCGYFLYWTDQNEVRLPFTSRGLNSFNNWSDSQS